MARFADEPAAQRMSAGGQRRLSGRVLQIEKTLRKFNHAGLRSRLTRTPSKASIVGGAL
jgi:hypothetical protein